MSDLRKAAQQALEALESSRVFVTSREKTKHPEGTEWYDERVDALRAALAQPEQEPVTWRYDYTRLPQRKPLTDAEMREVLKTFYFDPNVVFGDVVRAIEKAHGIQNV